MTKTMKIFFIEKNLKEDFSKIIRARETPILTKFKKKRYIWTTFSKDQVDLNYNNSKVLLKMINVMIENIINQNIKIIRLDAIGYIIKDLKTTNFNHPKIHIILKILKRVIKVLNLKTLLLTEINNTQEENLKYLKKDEADLTYNFSLPPLILYSFIKQNTTKLKNYLKNNELMLNKNLLLNFTSSHDGIGLNPIKDILNEKDVNLLIKQVKKRNGKISYKKEKDKKIPYELNINFLCAITSEDQSVKQMEKIFLVSQALILCLKGIPLIYIHSLIGSSNKKNPKTNRDINREKLTYTNLKKRIEQNSIFQNYLNLIKIKNKEKAFSPKAKIKFLKSSGKIVMFLRGDEDEKILCVLNFSNKKIKQKIKSKKFKNLIKNEKIEINKEIEIKPYEFLWLKFIQQ